MMVPREQVAQQLAVSSRVLQRYESLGFVRVQREGDVEGYAPADIRRILSIVCYQRDLGINLAGVEVVLKLRDHLNEVHRQIDRLARELTEALDEDVERGPDSDA